MSRHINATYEGIVITRKTNQSKGIAQSTARKKNKKLSLYYKTTSRIDKKVDIFSPLRFYADNMPVARFPEKINCLIDSTLSFFHSLRYSRQIVIKGGLLIRRGRSFKNIFFKGGAI